MGIRRLNHAVLYVRDVERSIAFYRDVLGFRVVHRLQGAAFLRAAESDNDHDLGLFALGADAAPSPAGKGAVGLYHLAWAPSPSWPSTPPGCARPARWSARRTT
jgi:catechol 2,3-dioxygenase-like lactoylglutathione lyase family enzyme